MGKPWYRSTAILGALTSALGVLTSPAIFNLLPPKAANVVAIIGAAAAAIGIRRAIPNPAP